MQDSDNILSSLVLVNTISSVYMIIETYNSMLKSFEAKTKSDPSIAVTSHIKQSNNTAPYLYCCWHESIIEVGYTFLIKLKCLNLL